MNKKDELHPIYIRIREVAQVKTDKHLAEMLNVSQPAVNRWKYKGEIKRERLERVAKLTGASLGWLLTGEGEKFPSNKPARTEHSNGSERVALSRVAPTASVVPMKPLPIVGLLKNHQLQQTQERTMNLPQTIVSATALVIEIDDESFASEGFHKGDALIVEEINGQDCEGKMVVAEWSEGVIIRRLTKNNGFARFPASMDGQPEFSIPAGDLKLRYILKSVIHLQA